MTTRTVRRPGLRFDLSDVGDSKELRRILARVTQGGAKQLEVGIFTGAGQSPGGAEGGPEGTSPAVYMMFQEYGTATIDETPWFRTSLAKNADKYGERLAKGAAAILDGSSTADEVLFRLGAEVSNDLKRSVVEFGLVDTGTARNSITWQVVDGTQFAGGLVGRAELDEEGT